MAERRVDLGPASPSPMEDGVLRRRRAAPDGWCSYALPACVRLSRFFGLAGGFVFRWDGMDILPPVIAGCETRESWRPEAKRSRLTLGFKQRSKQARSEVRQGAGKIDIFFDAVFVNSSLTTDRSYRI